MKVTQRRKLPNGRLSLTVFGLGCSALGGTYRPPEPRDASAVLAAAWTGGLRYFDTAPYYGYTRSEQRAGVLRGR
jgi:D-threo-aldose 1-dehydrogenase